MPRGILNTHFVYFGAKCILLKSLMFQITASSADRASFTKWKPAMFISLHKKASHEIKLEHNHAKSKSTQDIHWLSKQSQLCYWLMAYVNVEMTFQRRYTSWCSPCFIIISLRQQEINLPSLIKYKHWIHLCLPRNARSGIKEMTPRSPQFQQHSVRKHIVSVMIMKINSRFNGIRRRRQYLYNISLCWATT